MITILPPTLSVLMVAMSSPVPAMNSVVEPLTTMLNHLHELENHANKQVGKKALQEEMHQRVASGLKPNVVEVTNKTIIDGVCVGKNVWDDMLRSTTTRYLDVSNVHIKE